MRSINVSLDDTTWALAKEKTNFSAWVRDQLRSERNKKTRLEVWKYCKFCDKSMKTLHKLCVNSRCEVYLEHETEVLE